MPTALITGATRGLGRALVLNFAREGWRVYATGRTQADLDALATEARRAGLDIRPVRADAASDADTEALAERLTSDVARLDALIHNAAILGARVELAEYPVATWDAVIAANVRAPFVLTRRLLPLFARTAAVIFVSSGITEKPHARWGGYYVSKVALEGLAGTWAVELQPRGIRVFVVNPGPMRTEMRAAAFPREDPMTLPAPEERTGVFLWLAKEAGIELTGRHYEADEFARAHHRP